MKKRLIFAAASLAMLAPTLSEARGFFGGFHHFGGPRFVEPFEPVLWPFEPYPTVIAPQTIAEEIPVHELHPVGPLKIAKNNATEVKYTMAIPGRTHGDVTVETDPESRMLYVSIKGGDSQESDDSSDGVTRHSYSSSAYASHQSQHVPADADLSSIKANVHNGILTITMQKMTATPQQTRHSVKVQQNNDPALG